MASAVQRWRISGYKVPVCECKVWLLASALSIGSQCVCQNCSAQWQPREYIIYQQLPHVWERSHSVLLRQWLWDVPGAALEAQGRSRTTAQTRRNISCLKGCTCQHHPSRADEDPWQHQDCASCPDVHGQTQLPAWQKSQSRIVACLKQLWDD